MDASKWKSVVIPIKSYKLLTEMAKREHRTISGEFTYILEQFLDTKEEVKE